MKQIPVRNPRNGELDYQIDCWESAELLTRANDLRTAQEQWLEAGVASRCARLAQWRAAIASRQDDIATALCVDTGRRSFARLEVHKILGLLDHWIERAPQLLAAAAPAQSAMQPTVRYEHRLVPYPLVGIISPWNVPLILALIDAIPALAAGSAVMLKPSEITPRFAAPLAETLLGIEGLEQVLAIVTGDAQTGRGVIDAVDTICFTGSVATGRKVAQHAAERFIPAFLELGGKDPAIVLPDADLNNATTAIVRSAIGMTGQACQSLERVLVHRDVYDDTLAALVTKAEAVTLNWPDLGKGQIGPLIHGPQAEVIQRQLDDARERGAMIHCGGRIEHHGGGAWCLPTVISNLSPDMLLMQEETFGPLIPVQSFNSDAEAIALANDSVFGLSAAVFGTDPARLTSVAEALNVGAVSINDASLTAMVNDVEKNSFGLSGMGGSRMGDTGLLRFLRKRALLFQQAAAAPIQVFDEGLGAKP